MAKSSKSNLCLQPPMLKQKLHFKCSTENMFSLQAKPQFVEYRFVVKTGASGEGNLTFVLHHLLHLCQVLQWRLLLPHPSQLQASSSPQYYQFEKQNEEFHLCFPKHSRNCRTILIYPQNTTVFNTKFKKTQVIV